MLSCRDYTITTNIGAKPLPRSLDTTMMNRKVRAALWLAMVGAVVVPTAQVIVAQSVLCFKKTCLVYPDGKAICEYKPVDCATIQ